MRCYQSLCGELYRLPRAEDRIEGAGHTPASTYTWQWSVNGSLPPATTASFNPTTTYSDQATTFAVQTTSGQSGTPPGNYEIRPKAVNITGSTQPTGEIIEKLCVADPTVKLYKGLTSAIGTSNPPPEVTNQTIVASVGERIDLFVTTGSNCAGAVPGGGGSWSVPGSASGPSALAVKNYVVTTGNGTSTVQYLDPATDLKNRGISFYWVAPSTSASVGQGTQAVTFSHNGVTGKVTFDIRRPTVAVNPDNNGQIVCGLIEDSPIPMDRTYGQAFGLTPASSRAGIYFNGSGLTLNTSAYAGQSLFAQTIANDTVKTQSSSGTQTTVDTGLDNRYPYGNMTFPSSNTAPSTNDSPEVGFGPDTANTANVLSVDRVFDASMWLMYQPTTVNGSLLPNSIPVPLTKVTWGFNANCSFQVQPDGSYTGIVNSSSKKQLVTSPTLEYPQWTSVATP